MIIDYKELTKIIEEEDIDVEFVIISLHDGRKLIAKMYDVLGSETPYVILKDVFYISYDETTGFNFSHYVEYSEDRFILFNILKTYSFYNASLDYIDLYNEVVNELYQDTEEPTPIEESSNSNKNSNVVSLSLVRKSKDDSD